MNLRCDCKCCQRRDPPPAYRNEPRWQWAGVFLADSRVVEVFHWRQGRRMALHLPTTVDRPSLSDVLRAMAIVADADDISNAQATAEFLYDASIAMPGRGPGVVHVYRYG